MTSANVIHPTAVVADTVELGTGNIIGPLAVLLGPTRIGDNNWVGAHVAIGTPADMRQGEHPPPDQDQGIGVRIGNHNRIREFVTIQQGTHRQTQIGNDCYIMTRAYIPHDAILTEGATLAASAQIGGHTWVGTGANIGLAAQVVQRSRIGGLAMIGMNSTVTKDVPPFALMMGTPARLTGANKVGMQRAGYADEVIAVVEDQYRTGEAFTMESAAPEELHSLLEEYEQAQGGPPN